MALDITTQTWFSSASTADANMEAMQVYLVQTYDEYNLSDTVITALGQFTQQLTIMKKREVEESKSWSIYSAGRYADLDQQHNDARITLGQELQARINAGYNTEPDFIVP